jgi:gentisate 1,2-dioxygenase
MKPFTLNRPERVKMSLEEAEALVRLKEAPEWEVFKKIVRRHITELQKSIFWISYQDEKLIEKHAEGIGQAYGMEKMIELVEESGKKKGEVIEK